MSHQVSGLAASIRSAVESETFDLAGQTPSSIEKSIRDAFSDPLPLSDMIRLTFITGAGKLARQKYDEGAAKAVTATLRELGFEEDRGASAVLECAGTFKNQHDTGKNLKTVVVFPKVSGAVQGGIAGLTLSDNKQKSSVLDDDSPEHKIAFSPVNVFKRMIESRCPSWTQKKACSAAVDSLRDIVKRLDEKLVTGTPLDEPEQEFYDSVSLNTLEEKQACIKELMHEQVEAGQITADERRALLEQINGRLAALEKDIAAADKEGKAKRAENLKMNHAKAAERKDKIEKFVPKGVHPLKNEAEILRLRKEAASLSDIEEAAKGRLLTLKESQAVARKEEIAEEIRQLEESSRGWYETDEYFQARVNASKAAWREKMQAKKKVAKPNTPLPQTSKWATAPASRKVAPATKKAASSSKANRGGSLFAAMMNESDSD